MFEDTEFDPETVPLFKLGFHLAQIVFVVVLWILEIVVFRSQDSVINGNVGWTFAVCFLSVPAWIYLAMAPRFPRTRKFAQPYVMACVDGFFAIVWLSAFSTQAAYNTANKCGQGCGASKAIVGLGFIVFLLFCVTTFISIYSVKFWQWNNRLPGYDKIQRKGGGDIDLADPDKAAFSMAPHDDEAYAPVHMDDHDADPRRGAGAGAGGLGADPHSDPFADPYGAPSHVSDPYAASSVVGSQVSTSYGGAQENPFRQDANPFDSDNERDYHRPTPPQAAGRYAPPTAQDDFEDDTRPVHFPNADYDRITR